MTESSSNASRIIDTWYLGKTSTTHETSGHGAATISTGQGDKGGVSYGAYQLSTNAGTLDRYLRRSSYREHFSGLEPATDAFNAKWRELAKSEPGFGAEQHDFIRRTHYEIRVRELQASGIDLTDRGRAVQDALWSTSVQFAGGTLGIVDGGLTGKFGSTYALSKLSDKDIVEAIQDYKVAHNSELFRSSRGNWNGLLRRAREEKEDLVKLADYENTLAREGLLTDWRQSTTPPYAAAMQHGSNQPAADDVQAILNELGYTDAHGRALEIDGHYGKRTHEAVASFQRDQGLSADGIAGPNTWAALQEATRATSMTPPMAPAIIPEATAELPTGTFPQIAPPSHLDVTAIRTLQQQLNMLGTTDHRNQALPLTGTYDDVTRFAVGEFQRGQGLPDTGLADPATRTLIEARATIATLQQSATLHAAPAHENSLLEAPMRTSGAPSVTTQNQSSPPAEKTPQLGIAPVSHFTHSVGTPSATPLTSPESVTSRPHHEALSDQNPLAAIQAQLHDMQRQMEAMHRQREQDRERERRQENSRTMPNEPARNTSHEAPHPEALPSHADEPLSYSNPNHPQHGLYARLKELLPPGTMEERLEQSTAACYMGRITRPQQLDQIHIHDDAVHFLTTRPDAYASINLDQPAPTVQQTMQQVQTYDQQQAQRWAQFEVQQREINARGGPTLRGPVLH